MTKNNDILDLYPVDWDDWMCNDLEIVEIAKKLSFLKDVISTTMDSDNDLSYHTETLKLQKAVWSSLIDTAIGYDIWDNIKDYEKEIIFILLFYINNKNWLIENDKKESDLRTEINNLFLILKNGIDSITFINNKNNDYQTNIQSPEIIKTIEVCILNKILLRKENKCYLSLDNSKKKGKNTSLNKRLNKENQKAVVVLLKFFELKHIKFQNQTNLYSFIYDLFQKCNLLSEKQLGKNIKEKEKYDDKNKYDFIKKVLSDMKFYEQQQCNENLSQDDCDDDLYYQLKENERKINLLLKSLKQRIRPKTNN